MLRKGWFAVALELNARRSKVREAGSTQGGFRAQHEKCAWDTQGVTQRKILIGSNV